jgi:hypothetical protein
MNCYVKSGVFYKYVSKVPYFTAKAPDITNIPPVWQVPIPDDNDGVDYCLKESVCGMPSDTWAPVTGE